MSGCLALASVTARPGSRVQLTGEDAAAMATALLNINVHGKAVKDRQICLELLIALYQVMCAETTLELSGMPCTSTHLYWRTVCCPS